RRYCQWPSMKPTFIAGSWRRVLNRTGRSPTISACSDMRVARLADRVEAKVATARTSVPPAVAREAIVAVSTRSAGAGGLAGGVAAVGRGPAHACAAAFRAPALFGGARARLGRFAGSCLLLRLGLAGRAGGARQRLDRALEVPGDHLDVRQRVVV